MFHLPTLGKNNYESVPCLSKFPVFEEWMRTILHWAHKHTSTQEHKYTSTQENSQVSIHHCVQHLAHMSHITLCCTTIKCHTQYISHNTIKCHSTTCVAQLCFAHMSENSLIEPLNRSHWSFLLFGFGREKTHMCTSSAGFSGSQLTMQCIPKKCS